MNFRFNRKPLKEKIYKWYVCGYYDINARAVEDNLTTNDVEEAKDFAWELVNRGDFVIVKNMHNGKSAIINEDDVFDDVSEYLNDIFRSIDGRTNESLKEDANEKMVIYTQMGEYCVTPKSNYGGRMQNSRKVHHMKDFESAREVMDYWNKYFHTTDDDFIIINESLKEDISDYEIDKVYKKLSKLNKVDFGALENEYLKCHPGDRDVVNIWYGTVLNNKRICGEFERWVKEEKGIELKGLPRRKKNESLLQDIHNDYTKLSKINGVNIGKLEDEFQNTHQDFFDEIDFHGSVMYSREAWEAFKKWAKKEKGIIIKDLKGSRKNESIKEDLLPDEVYDTLTRNAKKTYVVSARDRAPYHYEINTEYGIYAKVPNGEGFLAHWFLDSKPQDTVEDMEYVAKKYIDKYDCEKVSVQEYKKIVNGRR